MFSYHGKTALVTGASSGIGEAFVRTLAARGMTVILVARSGERLATIADELTQQHGVRAEVLTCDLSEPMAVGALAEAVHQRGLTVDLLVNNAGFGMHGPFEALSPAREQQEVQVNIAAMVALTHAFAPMMLERGMGGIINVASVVGLQPVPYMAVYGATKAFVLSFTYALAEEYRGRGIRCLALCPGTTATGFYQDAGGEEVFARMQMRTSAQVVTTGLRALDRGRRIAIDGAANQRTFRLTHALPDAVSARILGATMRPKPRLKT